MEFDYYIYIDYSENLIGYDIIEKDKIAKLLPKLVKFKHYRNAENKKLYLKNISKTIKKEDIKTYFYNVRKINCTIYGADSCEQLSDFSEHPKNPINKPHLLRCGKREGFFDIKILRTTKNMEVYLDVLDFLKKHSNCIVFISVDNNEYDNFIKLVEIIDSNKTKVVKESELRKGTPEYKLSLVIDNLLNIERIKNKNK